MSQGPGATQLAPPGPRPSAGVCVSASADERERKREREKERERVRERESLGWQTEYKGKKGITAVPSGECIPSPIGKKLLR